MRGSERMSAARMARGRRTNHANLRRRFHTGPILPDGAQNANGGCTLIPCLALRKAKGPVLAYNPLAVPSPSTNLASGPTPSRTRWKILALLTLISIITYVDRVHSSVAARQMMPALGLTPLHMGYVFSAFVLGYALFQIPGGWLGDRLGVRKVLAAAILWWSFFTACTAVAGTLPSAAWLGILGSLLLVRFLIGVGEAAALTNFNRTVADWLPPQERGFGIGVSIGGIGIGASLTPPAVAWIMVNYGWQSAFYLS